MGSSPIRAFNASPVQHITHGISLNARCSQTNYVHLISSFGSFTRQASLPTKTKTVVELAFSDAGALNDQGQMHILPGLLIGPLPQKCFINCPT